MGVANPPQLSDTKCLGEEGVVKQYEGGGLGVIGVVRSRMKEYVHGEVEDISRVP